jgi:outer membrane protein OmpA-like peptidoglycan-associated protein
MNIHGFAIASTIALALAAPAAAQQVMTSQQLVRQLKLDPDLQIERPQVKVQVKRPVIVHKRAPQQNDNIVVMRRGPQQNNEVQPAMRAPQAQEEVVVREFRSPEPNRKKTAKSRAPQQQSETVALESRAPEKKAGKTAKSRSPEQSATDQKTTLAAIETDGTSTERGIAVTPKEPSDYRQTGRVDLEILFEYDSARIDPKSVKQLIALGEALNDPQLGKGVFLIAGHTDAKGGDAYNLDLSLRRAEAVTQFLVDFAGVERQRLKVEGFGRELLKYPDAPESGQNRRVEIINLGEAG